MKYYKSLKTAGEEKKYIYLYIFNEKREEKKSNQISKLCNKQ